MVRGDAGRARAAFSAAIRHRAARRRCRRRRRSSPIAATPTTSPTCSIPAAPPAPPRASPISPTTSCWCRRGTARSGSTPPTTWSTPRRRNISPTALWPGLLIPLRYGATLVLDRRPPTPDVVMANLRKHGVTKLVTVPTVLKNMIELLRQDRRSGELPAAEIRGQRVGKDAAGNVRAFPRTVRHRAARLDRQFGDHLRVDRQPAEGVQARQPRQAGVRLRGAADRARRQRRDASRTSRARPGSRARPPASTTGASTTSRARPSSATGRAPATTCRSTRTASSGSAAATTTCSRSRACGCRRSTSRRR